MMLINGKQQSNLSVMDRGLQYGDGLFETIALRNGVLEFWGAHLERLQQGAERLSIPMPEVAQLRSEAEQLLEHEQVAHQQQIESGVLKIMITRGAGGRGYCPPDPTAPTRILSLKPWPYSSEQQSQAEQQGVKLHICNTRLGDNPVLAGIKHLNRL